jgi:tetratricopeptide (TPR) repeat protein
MWHYLGEHQWLDDIAKLAKATFLLHYNLGRLAEGAKLSAKVRASLSKENPAHFFALGSLCVWEAAYLKYLASFSESVAMAEEGLSYLQQSFHPEAWRRIITGLNEAGVSSYHLGQFEEAKSYYQRAIELATKHNDLGSKGIFESNLANLLWHLGDYENAQRIMSELIEYHRKMQDWERAASVLGSLATVKGSMKKCEEARNLLEQALDLLEQHQIRSAPVLCDLSSELGKAHGCLGNKTRACHYHETALALTKEIASPLYESSVLSDYAYTLTAMGEYARAEEYLRRCITILWAGNDRGRLLLALIGQAKNELAKGENHKAAELLGLVFAQNELAPKDRQAAAEVLEGLQRKISRKELNNLLGQGKMLNLESVVSSIITQRVSSKLELSI